ncbi:hypothetical protein NHQ30_000143 [Ciborinia camelliae]|nr:hypothetical protein NHQ30_000143 [Ciborinia camelliae]
MTEESRDTLTREDSRAGLSSPQELEVESYRIWLILGQESAMEMKGGDSEEDACYEASMWNWMFLLDNA